jgi:hypothetical protein
MASPDIDRNQVNREPRNPNQEAKDPRIAMVIGELIEATSAMRNPDYDDVNMIVYESADKSTSVSFHRNQFPRTGDYPPEPSRIRYENRVFPVIPASMGLETKFDVTDNERYYEYPSDYEYLSKDVLLYLNPDDPKVFQIANNDGNFITSDNKRTARRASVVEHPELVPPLLDAVSGRKGIRKTFRGGLDTPMPEFEWKNTFEPHAQPQTPPQSPK